MFVWRLKKTFNTFKKFLLWYCKLFDSNKTQLWCLKCVANLLYFYCYIFRISLFVISFSSSSSSNNLLFLLAK